MKFLFSVLTLLMVVGSSHAQPYSYLTAEAQPGDGMYALFRRYQLPVSSCHVDKFLALNELTPKQALLVGATYRLPILIYPYNGNSIRSTIGIPDLSLAKRIQAFNRKQEKSGQQPEPYEKSKILWVPYSDLFCESKTQNSNSENGDAIDLTRLNVPPQAPAEAVPVKEEVSSPNKGYSIFGEQYADVKRKNQKLAGKVFYLVSGHGGPDPGAIGSKKSNTLCEDEYAYDVVLRLARSIIEHGGTPYIIVRDRDDGIRDEEFLDCDYDEQVWGDLAIPLDQRERLEQRSETINQLAKQRKSNGVTEQYCIVVHVDSRHEDKQTDLFFYHQKGSEQSQALTEEMHATMRRNYKRNGRSREYTGSILTRDLHMLREVDVPTVYIELGNIQHSFDQKRVLQARNRQALANWFTEGIIRGTNR